MKTDRVAVVLKHAPVTAFGIGGNFVSHLSLRNIRSAVRGVVTLSLGGAACWAAAQDNPAVSPVNQVNGYAENLKPTKAKASAPGNLKTAVVNLPYTPIRKLDDEGQTAEIEMFVGESRVFPAPGVARIAVGNGSLLTAAALDSKEVILFANGAGTSSLFIWNADGRYQRVKISIVPGDTSKHAREIAAFLSTIPRAKASIVGANIIVEGDELSDADLAKVVDLSKRYPQIVNFTNRVGWEQMIMMDVKVVEFPTTVLRDIGMQWNPTGGGAIGGIWSPGRRGNAGPYEIAIRTAPNNAPPITGVGGAPTVVPSGLNLLSYLNLGLNAQLNLLAQEGKATLLAEPQLSARSGSKAMFTAGGEIPYSIRTNEGIVVQFKSYGIKLDITPRVDHKGVIRATLMAEVSSVDKSITTAGGPALLSRRTETEFNVRAGETMVLAGLLTREASNDVDKVPLLGDIPFLGAAFRSTRQQNKETELVVFVTPTLVQANSPAVADRVNKTTERLQERMGATPYLSEPLQPGVSYEQPNVMPASASGSSGIVPAAVVPVAVATPGPVGLPVRAVVGEANAVTNHPALTLALPIAAARTEAATRQGLELSVKVDSTPLTSEPGGGTVLLMLDQGVVVYKTGLEPHSTSGKSWRRVVVDGLTGWVNSDALVATSESSSVSTAALLAGAGSDLSLRRPLPMGKDRAQFKALTLDRASADARKVRVAKGGTELRITPDINAEVVSRVVEGETLSVLPHPSRGVWTAVQLGDGDSAKRGWVISQALKNATP